MTPTDFERLLHARGKSALGLALLEGLNRLCDIEEVFAFHSYSDGVPVPIASASYHDKVDERVQIYTSSFHRLDPMMSSFRCRTPSQRLVTIRVNAADIADKRYREQCYGRPRFIQKVAFGQFRHNGWSVLNLYRGKHGADVDLEGAQRFARFAMPIVNQHVDTIERQSQSPLKRIERSLALHFADLSDREAQVIARSLIGMTAEGIGYDLGIASSSVQTYRKRAHARYEFTSSNQFIGSMIS